MVLSFSWYGSILCSARANFRAFWKKQVEEYQMLRVSCSASRDASSAAGELNLYAQHTTTTTGQVEIPVIPRVAVALSFLSSLLPRRGYNCEGQLALALEGEVLRNKFVREGGVEYSKHGAKHGTVF